MAVLQVSLGIGRYIEYLLSYWAGHLDSDEITVIVSEPIDLTSFGVTSVVISSSLFECALGEFPVAAKDEESRCHVRASYILPILSWAHGATMPAAWWRSTASMNSVRSPHGGIPIRMSRNIAGVLTWQTA